MIFYPIGNNTGDYKMKEETWNAIKNGKKPWKNRKIE